jgi:hypothetical protein
MINIKSVGVKEINKEIDYNQIDKTKLPINDNFIQQPNKHSDKNFIKQLKDNIDHLESEKNVN